MIRTLLCCAVVAGFLGHSVEAQAPVVTHVPTGSRLYLELVVNGVASGLVVPVYQEEDGLRIAARDLRDAAVPVDGADDHRIAVDRLPGVIARYDEAGQRLEIRVPARWLSEQVISVDRGADGGLPETVPGATINYDGLVRQGADGSFSTATWIEARAFSPRGVLSTSGRHQYRVDGQGRWTSAFVRYDTNWQHTSRQHMVTVAVGDVVSGAHSWSRALRLGGISVSRNFSIRPDLVTYPVPEFRGQVDVPSTVDVLLGGRTVTGTGLQPGPFIIENLPVVNGAGTATFVTTDVLGRRLERHHAFYVASTLLRKGLWDYSVSAGALRQDYAASSLAYGRPAAIGVARYGLSNQVTIEGHGGWTPRHTTAGLGGTVRVGRAGVVGVAASESWGRGLPGHRYTVRYEYQAPGLSVVLRREHQSDTFVDLSAETTPLLPAASTRSTQALLSFSPGRRVPVSVGYLRADGPGRTTNGLVSFSASVPGVARGRLSATGLYRLGQGRGLSTQVSLTIPLGRRGTLHAGASQAPGGPTAFRTSLRRPAPADGGIGFDVAAGTRDEHQAAVTWRTRAVELQGGVSTSGTSQTTWGSARGALVLVKGRLVPAGRVSDGFILVETNGHEGVPVLFENQRVGTTDGDGRLVVPGVSAYHSAKVSIDPLGLPADIRVGATERQVTVRKHGGTVVTFDLRRLASASLRLIAPDGVPLPVGTRVTHSPGGTSLVVGWGGLVYVENTSAENVLVATLPDGSTCSVGFADTTRRLRFGATETLECQP